MAMPHCCLLLNVAMLLLLLMPLLLLHLLLSTCSDDSQHQQQRQWQLISKFQHYQQQHQQQRLESASSSAVIAVLAASSNDASLSAIEESLQHLGTTNGTVPSGVQLRAVYVDTECSPGKATQGLFDILHHLPAAFVIFVSDCPGLAGQMSQISYFWNITLVTYADTSPELSDPERYKNLVRVIPNDADFNLPRLKLMQLFNWTKSCSLYQDSIGASDADTQAAANANLDDLLEAEGVTKDDASSLKFKSFESAMTVLTKLKAKDFRVISALTGKRLLPALFCAAYNTGMFGQRHVWTVSGFRVSLSTWSPSEFQCNGSSCNCSREQVLMAANNSFYIDIVHYLSDVHHHSITRLSSQHNPYKAYSYDGVTAVSTAMRSIFQMSNITMENELRNVRFQSALEATNFQGLTGPVRFHNGARLGLLMLTQLIISSNGQPELKSLGEFDCAIGKFRNVTKLLQSIVWAGDGPPRDRTDVENRLVTLQLWLFVLFSILSGIGILLSLCLMSINIRFRKHQYIKMSSPQMNNVIIIGCIMCYASVVLLGSDAVTALSTAGLIGLCWARAWVLSIGFTLSFGAMFGKTWRVHFIFTNVNMNKKIIKDYQLLLIVIFLLLIDLCILLAWLIIDPMAREKQMLSIENLSNDREVHFYCEVCTSKRHTMWLALLFAYKGLLLVIGCFFAWETRNVSIPALNDSKYIGMSVYNVLVMCLAGAAVSFALKENQSASFTITSLLILACTSITLALVFFPKLIELRRDPRGEEKRIRATLHKAHKTLNRNDNEQQQYCAKLKSIQQENLSLVNRLEKKIGEIKSLQDELRVYKHQDSSSNNSSIGCSSSSSSRIQRSSNNQMNNKSAVRFADDGDAAEGDDDSIVFHNTGHSSHELATATAAAATADTVWIPRQQQQQQQQQQQNSSMRRTPSYPGLKDLPRLLYRLRETAIVNYEYEYDSSMDGALHQHLLENG